MVERVNRSEDVIYIAAIGAITNIASAILLDPGIVNKIVVIWLAGQPLEFGHGIEFNMMQDIEASQIILNSGVPLILIPCMNVAALLSASAEELKKNLEGKNPICDYLYRIVKKDFADMEAEAAMVKMDRSGYLRGREDRDEEYMSQFKSDHISWSRIIWDIAAIAYLVNPNWITSTQVHSPILNDDLTYTKDESRHLIRVANYCHRNFIFGEMFYRLTQE